MEQELAMRFNELAQNAEDDKSNQWDLDDTRRPKLTLRHLNKMRNRRELARAEHKDKLEDVQLQYSAAPKEQLLYSPLIAQIQQI